MTFFLPLSPLGDLLEHMIEGPVGQLHQQLNLLLAHRQVVEANFTLQGLMDG
jgi:hypothetical protein